MEGSAGLGMVLVPVLSQLHLGGATSDQHQLSLWGAAEALVRLVGRWSLRLLSPEGCGASHSIQLMGYFG